MTSNARVAIILVNHGDYAQRYLVECYRSLQVQSYPRGATTLFIVDNDGSENTLRFLSNVAPTARILQCCTNVGWGGGNNLAIQAALKEGHEYVVSLNMDTVVQPRWLEHLVAKADSSPDIHILQSKILLADTNRINSLGNRMHYLGFGYCNAHGKKETAQVPTAPMDFASGAAMLVKRQVFEKIGLFCEEYFMYYDDVEFCWRGRLAGFDVGLAADSICHHKYDFSRVLGSLFHLERNRLTTLFTMQKLGTLLVLAPPLVLSELVLIGYFIAMGWGRVRLRLWRYFLGKRCWGFIKERRKWIRSIRIRRDAQITKNFAATIVFPQGPSRAVRFFANPILWAYWKVARLLIVW